MSHLDYSKNTQMIFNHGKERWKLARYKNFFLDLSFASFVAIASYVPSSTLSGNLKLCPKIRFSENWQNCQFEVWCQKWMILSDLKLWFQVEFEFSRQKLQKFQDFQFFKILFLIKIMIFGAKIQIIQGIFALNIFQNIIDFHSKPQNYNFVFFRKLNFWT